jgi:hypothetical protein
MRAEINDALELEKINATAQELDARDEAGTSNWEST